MNTRNDHDERVAQNEKDEAANKASMDRMSVNAARKDNDADWQYAGILAEHGPEAAAAYAQEKHEIETNLLGESLKDLADIKEHPLTREDRLENAVRVALTDTTGVRAWLNENDPMLVKQMLDSLKEDTA